MGAEAPLAVRRGSRGKPSEGSPGRVFPPFLRVEKWGRSRRSEISCPFVLLCPSSVIRLAGDAGCHLPLRGRHFACGRDFVLICRNGSHPRKRECSQIPAKRPLQNANAPLVCVLVLREFTPSVAFGASSLREGAF